MPICRRNESKSGSFEKSITNLLSLALGLHCLYTPLAPRSDFQEILRRFSSYGVQQARSIRPHNADFFAPFSRNSLCLLYDGGRGPGSGGGLDDTLDMKNCLGNRERPDLALSITRCQRAHRTIRLGGYLGLNNFHISCLAVPFPCAPTRLPRMIYLREGQLAVLLAHFCVMSDWTATAGHSLYYR